MTGTAARANANRLAAVALFFLALIWGYNWVVMKIGLEYSQPFTFSALRTFFGAMVLFVMLVVMRRPLRPRALGLTALLGLLQTTGFVGLLTWALQNGGAGKTSVLTYTMPFWLLLMAWVVLGERLKNFQWVAVGCAFVGLLLVLRPWDLQGGLSELLAVGGAVSWAAGAVVAKILHKRHQVDLLSLTAWQMLLGSLPLILVAGLTWSGPPVWSGSLIVALLYNIFLGNAVAWMLWMYILNSLPAGTAGLGTLLTPVIGVASAWIQLGERPDWAEGLGMVAIVGALVLITVREIVVGARGRG
ncbi:MAG: DMT family transporter [Thermoleophilia bacterium]|jgi:drug/metabolite transporter (DMT)-like permease